MTTWLDPWLYGAGSLSATETLAHGTYTASGARSSSSTAEYQSGSETKTSTWSSDYSSTSYSSSNNTRTSASNSYSQLIKLTKGTTQTESITTGSWYAVTEIFGTGKTWSTIIAGFPTYQNTTSTMAAPVYEKLAAIRTVEQFVYSGTSESTTHWEINKCVTSSMIGSVSTTIATTRSIPWVKEIADSAGGVGPAATADYDEGTDVRNALQRGARTVWALAPGETGLFFSGDGPQPRSDGVRITGGETTSASAANSYSVVEFKTYRATKVASGTSYPTFAWTQPEVVSTWEELTWKNTGSSSTDYGVVPNTSMSRTVDLYQDTILSETVSPEEALTLNGVSSIHPVQALSVDTSSVLIGGTFSFTWGARTYFTTSGALYPNDGQVSFLSGESSGTSSSSKGAQEGASVAIIYNSRTGDIWLDPNEPLNEPWLPYLAMVNVPREPMLFYTSNVAGAQVAESGASTAAPSKSLVGGVPGSTLAVPTAWIKPAIHAPMPYPSFTAKPATATAASLSSLSSSCGWSGKTLHLTKTSTAGNTATSGPANGAETPDTALVVTGFEPVGGTTGRTYTMFVPAGEVVFRNTGSGETRSWFSCGTTATFAGGSEVSAISFEPAVFGPDLIGPAVEYWGG